MHQKREGRTFVLDCDSIRCASTLRCMSSAVSMLSNCTPVQTQVTTGYSSYQKGLKCPYVCTPSWGS